MVMEAEKSYEVPSVSYKHPKAGGGILFESVGLRTMGANGLTPSLRRKIWERGEEGEVEGWLVYFQSLQQGHLCLQAEQMDNPT